MKGLNSPSFWGKEFHRVGTATEEALFLVAANLASEDTGTCHKAASEDLSEWVSLRISPKSKDERGCQKNGWIEEACLCD